MDELVTERGNAEISPAADPARPGSAVGMPRLGATIRRLRLAKSLTIQELAERSDVSVGMLSQIERDRANPSLRILSQLRDALGASISALFEEEAPETAEPPFVARAHRRPRLELGYLQKELLAVGSPGGMQMMVLHLPPGADSGDHPMVAPIEKGGLVLEGTFVLRVAGTETVLDEGDSFLFDGSQPHGFRNPSDRPARVMWIMGAPMVERHL